jgi:ABC-type multidrug transport system fused ATPase/permease subunit
MGLGLLGAAAGLAQPLIVARVIRALGADESLLQPLAVLVALVVMSTIAGVFSGGLLDSTSERLTQDLRHSLTDRLIHLRVQVQDSQKSGDLMARVTADTTHVQAFTVRGLDAAVTGVLSIVVAFALMAFVDSTLLLLTLVSLVVMLSLLGAIIPRILAASASARKAVGDIGTELQRTLGAARTVKASGSEARELLRIDEATDRAATQGRRKAWLRSFTGGISGLATQTTFLLILGVGGARVASGATDIADLIAFLLYLLYLTGPISSIIGTFADAQDARASLHRLMAVERLEVETDTGTLTGVDRSSPHVLVFEGVSFAYLTEDGPGRKVLHDIDLAVPARGLTALVGPSGAGKTTLFSLIERFYEPTSGRILFGGRDVRDLERRWLREQIGYVEQDAPVLDGTLRANILLANPQADAAALEQAIRDASLEGLVAQLPNGLDTEVGERGVKLSGGERQRVAIARALLRSPLVLLLDEATAQLDAVNEQLLRQVVERVSERCAVVAIAHRLSTVARAGQIIVLTDGAVRAVGTHESLLAEDATYRELATTQLIA